MGYLFHILTLFPGYFDGPLNESILGKALERGLVEVKLTNIRDHADGVHRVTDDTPYGGGAGMVMKPEPVVAAIEAVRETRDIPIVLLTPQGRPFDQEYAQRMASWSGVGLVCGRYEGFDERIRHFCDDELSLGDFVVSGGEPIATVVVDAVMRLLPDVLGNQESITSESFSGQPILEYPQYTRPYEFRGLSVPDVLLSGHHKNIDRWRRGQALERTRQRRPELFEKLQLSREDRLLLEELDVIE